MTSIKTAHLLIGCLLMEAVFGAAIASPASVPNLSKSKYQAKVDRASVESASGLADPDLKALAALESTYFQRTYDSDNTDKRIKRLELFLNGSGRFGTLPQRLAFLKESAAAGRNGVKSATTPSRHGASQSIAQLELSILKKVNPKLDTETRLAILEKKVFGTAFANVPIDHRIARLQKTIGIGDDDLADNPLLTVPNSTGFPPGSFLNSPFMSPYSNGSGNGSGNGLSSDPEINRHMGEMFDQLNRQLRQLHSVPPDSYGFPRTQQPRQFANPDGGFGYSDGLPPMPKNGVRENPRLPPYLDPNSI